MNYWVSKDNLNWESVDELNVLVSTSDFIMHDKPIEQFVEELNLLEDRDVSHYYIYSTYSKLEGSIKYSPFPIYNGDISNINHITELAIKYGSILVRYGFDKDKIDSNKFFIPKNSTLFNYEQLKIGSQGWEHVYYWKIEFNEKKAKVKSQNIEKKQEMEKLKNDLNYSIGFFCEKFNNAIICSIFKSAKVYSGDLNTVKKNIKIVKKYKKTWYLSKEIQNIIIKVNSYYNLLSSLSEDKLKKNEKWLIAKKNIKPSVIRFFNRYATKKTKLALAKMKRK